MDFFLWLCGLSVPFLSCHLLSFYAPLTYANLPIIIKITNLKLTFIQNKGLKSPFFLPEYFMS